MRKLITKYRFQLSLGLIWLLLRIVINPMGEFPINDDWAYAHNTQALSEEGVYSFSFWPAMTLIAQTFWGALFSKMFGFSLFNLRMATMAMAIIGSLFFFALLKRETKNEKLSFLLTVALLANPFFISLSFTYMTEIYYLTFAGISFYFISRILRGEKWSDWVFLLIFVLLTVLVRQTGLIFTIAFALAYVLAKPIKIKRVLLSIVPFIVAFLGLEIYKHLRMEVDPNLGSLSEVGDLFRAISDISWGYILERVGLIFFYLGLMLTPVSLLLFSRLREPLNTKKILYVAFVLVPILICMFTTWPLFPWGNLLGNFELGPRLLKDTGLFGTNMATPLPELIWQVIRLISVVSVSVFVYSLYSIVESKQAEGTLWSRCITAVRLHPFAFMLGAIIAAQCVYIVINPIFFDRYVLPMMFTGLLLVGVLFNHAKKLNWRISIALTSVFLIVSSLMTRDLMSWYGARLTATNYLQFEMGISPSQLDGGFEFNAYHKVAGFNPTPVKTTDKSWWFVKEDKFLLTNGDFEGYRKVKGFPTNQWISTSADSVYIMEKIEP
ncbi:MAG: glycosyltransferase family 39 protein [Flavobacteriales bacterium]|nr:glycosyltransferase family 39 protein [Flavobacteriales bacterium]